MDLKKTEEKQEKEEIDYGIAFQKHLDTITLASLPYIKLSQVLELKAEDSVKEAIGLLHEKSVCGALIADTANGKFLDRYIGYIGFSDLTFWCFEEYEKFKGSEETENNIGVFSVLEECPNIGQTKISELAKSFLWRPFFPAYLDDTLFHAMLLLTKHRLEVVAVIDRSTSRAIGFVTPIEVTRTLLQSSGVEWFDRIADTSISKLRIENEERVVCVYRDQTLGEALREMWKNKIGIVAIVDRENRKLIGSLSINDDRLVTKSETLRGNNGKVTVEELLRSSEGDRERSDNTVTERLNLTVTIERSYTLKQVMETLTMTENCFGFIVDESQRIVGTVGIGSLISLFSPPCMDSKIHGDGFFKAALEQTGCLVEQGTLVCRP